MVGRERFDDLVVRGGESTRLAEAPAPDAAGDRRRVDVGTDVRVGDPVEQLEPPLGPRAAVVVLAGDERDDPAGVPGGRAELGVVEPLGDLGRLDRGRGTVARPPASSRDQRHRPAAAVGRRPRQRTIDPVVDSRALGHLLPDARAERRLVGQLGVELASHLLVVGLGDGVLHRLPEGLAREAERVRLAGRPEHVHAVGSRLSERQRLREQVERVDELVALHRTCGRALKPLERLRPRSLVLGVVSCPRELHVLRANRVGVVVREESSDVADVLDAPFDPLRERRVHARASRTRDPGVRRLARQRVLDRVLAVLRGSASRCDGG